jgi:predicted aspartyl protease
MRQGVIWLGRIFGMALALASLGCTGGDARVRAARAKLNRVSAGLPAAVAISPAATITLPLRPAGGHAVPHISGRLNDGPAFTFLIDSGGNHSVVSASKAKAATVARFSQIRADITTAFGNTESSVLGVADELTLADRLKLAGVPLLIHSPMGRRKQAGMTELNILGTPTLAAFSYLQLDYQARTATFSPRDRFTPPRRPVLRLPLEVSDSGHLFVHGQVHGRPEEIIVDTGYDGFFSMSAERAAALALARPGRKPITARAIGLGRGATAELRVLREVQLGNVAFTGVPCWTGQSGDDMIILGSGFLQLFRTTFDFATMTLWLEPRADLLGQPLALAR